jgi:DNA-binding NtrC family response regulator
MAKILLIENDPILARLIVSALRQDGHCLREAENLAAAQEAAQDVRQRFDLILFEASTGAPLASHHLGLMRTATMVFMSESASFVGAARIGRTDDQTLRKPFTAQQLRSCVRKALAHASRKPSQSLAGPRDWWLEHPLPVVDTYRRSFDRHR